MSVNKDHLSEEEIEVTQNCGTEPPFSGKLLYEKREGVYKCIVCHNSLFESETKFESGTGWPSFYDAIGETITKKEDNSFGIQFVLKGMTSIGTKANKLLERGILGYSDYIQ